MDLSENSQREWSDWFTKAEPARNEAAQAEPEGPPGEAEPVQAAVDPDPVQAAPAPAGSAPDQDEPNQAEPGPGELSPGELSPGELSPGELSPGELSPDELSPDDVTQDVPGPDVPGPDVPSQSEPGQEEPVLAGTEPVQHAAESDPAGSGPGTDEFGPYAVQTVAERAPVLDEPVLDQPVPDELGPGEPVVHEPVVHEPVVHEPVVHEPVVHEPVLVEPVLGEPDQGEPVLAGIEPAQYVAEPGPAGSGPGMGETDEIGPDAVQTDTEPALVPDEPVDQPVLEQSALNEPVLNEPVLDETEDEPIRDQPAGGHTEPGRETADEMRTGPAPAPLRRAAPPPADLPTRRSPSPPRPERVAPRQARPPVPQRPPGPRFIPVEDLPLPRRSRPAGAPPWILPEADRSRQRPADAPGSRTPGPRPPEADRSRQRPADAPGSRTPGPRPPGDEPPWPRDEPPWPARDDLAQNLSAGLRTEDRPARTPADPPPPAAPRPARPAEKAPPAGKSKSAGKSKGVTGAGQGSEAATYKEPEVVSGAETVMLPKQKPRQDAPDDQAAPAQKGASPRGRHTTNKHGSPALTADEATTIMPVQKAWTPPVADTAPPEQPYTPSQRRKWISRGVLLGILAMQAVFSLRLHNTAYLDEANYAFGGRLEIAHLFHGAAMPVDLNSTYSGSPVLYPVLSAWLNSIGGLVLARLFSLFEMLATTALLYAISRRLFNERVALCAALLFSACEPAVFLGNFATFDASCLMLLALSAWIVVRTALFRWPVFLLAAPVAALAVATKYAGLLFVPSVAVLPALAAWPYHRRRALAYPVVFGLAVAAVLYGAVRLAGPAYLHAVETTTTARAHGNTPIHALLWEAVQWGGIIFGLALLGTVAYAWRPRTEATEEISPAGSRLRRVVTGIVLTGSALLAPAYQAHLHTNESFQKHIGFGLFFAAPMAGVGLARIVGDHFRRPQLGIGIWGFAILLGMTQSAQLFASWANSQQFMTALTRQLKPGDRYLVEDAQVPEYYLDGKPGAKTSQFHDTFSMVYAGQGKILLGNAGFQAAIKAGYYNVVAYNFAETASVDTVIANALKANSAYKLAAQIPGTTADQNWVYYIWVKKTPG